MTILIGQYRRDKFVKYNESFWANFGHCNVSQTFEQVGKMKILKIIEKNDLNIFQNVWSSDTFYYTENSMKSVSHEYWAQKSW